MFKNITVFVCIFVIDMIALTIRGGLSAMDLTTLRCTGQLESLDDPV